MSQERLVNMAFITAALVLWFVSANLFGTLLDALPPLNAASGDRWQWDAYIIGREFRLSNLLGVAVGVAGGILLWRNEWLFTQAHEIAGELRKVSWPSWPEVRLSTVVVMITTVLVACVLWGFDTVFAFVSRLVYKI